MSISDEANPQARRRFDARRDADLYPLQDGPVGRVMSRSMTRRGERSESSGRHRHPTKSLTRWSRTSASRGPHLLCCRG